MRDEEMEFLGMKFLSNNTSNKKSSYNDSDEQDLYTFTEDIVTKNIHNSNPGRT